MGDEGKEGGARESDGAELGITQSGKCWHSPRKSKLAWETSLDFILWSRRDVTVRIGL